MDDGKSYAKPLQILPQIFASSRVPASVPSIVPAPLTPRCKPLDQRVLEFLVGEAIAQSGSICSRRCW
jgi:hypothetical protein